MEKNNYNYNSSYGYVYCMTNKYMPNLCKIGYVNKEDKTSSDRAKELSSNTSCPIEFDVIYDIKVRNPQKYERRIHKKLKNFRINQRREFFNCNPIDIIKYFDKNNLIKYDNENDDFPEFYLIKYRILQKCDINKIEINNKYIFVSYREVISSVCYIIYEIFRIILNLLYYFYILVKLLFNYVGK